MAIMGIVLIQNVTMLQLWNGVLTWITQTTGLTSYPVIFTLAFLVAVTVPVGLLWLPARGAACGNDEPPLRNLARFGYALIPLAVAGDIAHHTSEEHTT